MPNHVESETVRPRKIGVEQCNNPGGEDEAGPGEYGAAFVGSGIEQGFHHEGRWQKQAEHEAAVQVDPRRPSPAAARQARRGRGGRGPVTKAGAPQLEAQPRQQMRAGQHRGCSIAQSDNERRNGINPGQKRAGTSAGWQRSGRRR